MTLQSITNEELTHVTGGRERMTGDTGATKPYHSQGHREYSAPQPKLDWGASPSQIQQHYVRSNSWL
ncbi:MAG TPA: hypothetical protein VL326_31790 [Kofleriaceae bacterium]|jgi:hypothetical protein|nr:hypothetical protein [Kofleriaceae bacterium]